MKTTFQSTLQACLALIVALCASCTDDTFLQDDVNATGKRFELTVTQAAPQTRLELGQDGLTLKWEPGDQLVLIDKGRTKAPIYLTCDLTEAATSATFSAQTGVPADEYWVLYNYNESLLYQTHQFSSIEDINTNNKLVLYGSLTVTANMSTASVTLEHLYAKIRVVLENVPNSNNMDNINYNIGMYSTKKGLGTQKLLTSTGFVNAAWGQDPNSLMYGSYGYFPSDRKEHNIGLGSYNINFEYSDDGNGNWTYKPTNQSQLEMNSALIFPEDLSEEEVFIYVLEESWDYSAGVSKENRRCYEFKMATGKMGLEAGKSYKVTLDLGASTTVITELIDTRTSSNDNPLYEITNFAEWRHAAYRNGLNVKLTQSLDFQNEYFFPISGALDGNGMTLSNITLDRSTEENVGVMIGGNVSNLTLENATIKGKNKVGAFGGSNTHVTNCNLTGTSTVSGNNYVGGIVGCNEYFFSAISKVNVGNNCTITGANYVGGIIGAYYNYDSNSMHYSNSLKPLDTCISYATVTASGDYVGGIFGKMGGDQYNNASYISFQMEDHTFSLIKCQNEGNVTGNNYVGGVGGSFAISNSGGTIIDRVVLKQSFSSGAVNGKLHVGGIVGSSHGNINTCYSINTISGTDSIGGIVGNMNTEMSSSRVANCFSIADLTATSATPVVGGIVGDAGGNQYRGSTIKFSYFAGTNATNCGIVGSSSASCTVENCLTTLSSLGTNLGAHDISIPDGYWDDTTQTMIYSKSCPDVINDSHASVTSIKNNKSIINGDEAYSDNVWANYSYDCLKFASFSAETDAPSYDPEVDINP